MNAYRGSRGLGIVAVSLAVVLAAAMLPAGLLFAQAQLPSPALQKLQSVARDLFQRRQWPEALVASEQVLEATRSEFGRDHEQVAVQAYGLGLVAEAAARLDVAERAFREAIRVMSVVYGQNEVVATQSMEKLAEVLVKSGRPGEAEPILQRVLAVRSGLLGADHAYNASTHAGLGAVRLAHGDAGGALVAYRQAIRLLTRTGEIQTAARQVQDNEIRRQVTAFAGFVEAAWREARRSPGLLPGLREESFAASQQAWTTAAGAALARMAARLATGDTDLGRRVQRQQQATELVLALHQEDARELTRWSAVQRDDPVYAGLLEEFRQESAARYRDSAPTVKRQTALVAKLQDVLKRCPPGQDKAGCADAGRERDAITRELSALSAAAATGSGDLMALHGRMEAAEARLPGYAAFKAARDARIAEQTRLERVAIVERQAIAAAFPDYVALMEPKPLTLAQAGALLGADEALVTVLVGPDRSYVWAVTRETSAWAPIEAGSRALAEDVAALRLDLDPLARPDRQGADPATGPAFDLVRAHALYRTVLGPVAAVIASKRHLILVPTGPLTSLPFQVLLTDPPEAGQSGRQVLKRVPWLVRRHALSVLPSVPALAALRRVALPLAAAEPFLGIGDPALTGPLAPTPKARGAATPADVYRDGKPDLRALKQMVPLPETADELTAIADVLKSTRANLFLRNEATETRIRRTDLRRFRVIHFATHGLVAGELSGLVEPALVLTPPIRPSDIDDGLLTASEVATLQLNADWVVLSACNTASGAEVGADALSGLARAFFFAGARALLVSHWAVNSEATVWLTTGTFKALAAEPGIGRAEAFRRTMLAMIDAGLPPSDWAPFVIVGEGAGAR